MTAKGVSIATHTLISTQLSLHADKLAFGFQLLDAVRKIHWLETTFVAGLNKVRALKKEHACHV